jgi:hypothetical protein
MQDANELTVCLYIYIQYTELGATLPHLNSLHWDWLLQGSAYIRNDTDPSDM